MPEDAPYDPYIPSGQAAGGAQQQGAGGNARTQALQAVSCDAFLDRASLFSRWTGSLVAPDCPTPDDDDPTELPARLNMSPMTPDWVITKIHQHNPLFAVTTAIMAAIDRGTRYGRCWACYRDGKKPAPVWLRGCQVFQPGDDISDRDGNNEDCIDRIPSAVFVEPDDNSLRHPPLENPILACFRRRRRNQGPDPCR